MNILFVGFTINQNAGGAERYCYNILKELSDRKHNVYVYADESEKAEPTFISVNKHVKKKRFVDYFLLGFRIKRFLRKRNTQIDLFICGHIFLFKKCEQISKSINVKYDLFVYGIDCWGNRFKERMGAMNSLRKVVSISGFTTQQLRDQGFYGEIVYFPPLVETITENSFIPKQQDKNLILLTVARLDANERYKGHDVVFEALQLIGDKLPKIEYWIVGRGNDSERLQALARAKRLGNVKFLGFVADDKLPEIYANADIFIMPSRVSLDPSKLEGEGFGIVFTEAALYKKALIGPNTGGSTDIIDNEINGLSCDPRNSSEIANCILRLAADEDLRRQLGENARKKVLKNFTMRQFDQYFKKLL